MLRHAKSSWDDPSLRDHDRPLDDRGERAAVLMGAYMQQEGIAPDLILCSSAQRTRQTLKGLLPYLPDTTDVRIEPRIYESGTMGLFELAAAVDDGVEDLLMIGHNPGTHMLVCNLAGSGHPDLLDAIRFKYPTAGLASIRFQGPLSSMRGGEGELVRFAVPKKLV